MYFQRDRGALNCSKCCGKVLSLRMQSFGGTWVCESLPRDFLIEDVDAFRKTKNVSGLGVFLGLEDLFFHGWGIHGNR